MTNIQSKLSIVRFLTKSVRPSKTNVNNATPKRVLDSANTTASSTNTDTASNSNITNLTTNNTDSTVAVPKSSEKWKSNLTLQERSDYEVQN